MLVDTPGMRELGIIGANEGMNAGFDALVSLAAQCRYADCSHKHEPGCAVREAVDKGELSEDRYASYVKLKKESEHYEMSYQDKRKKDKAFGKSEQLLDAVMKLPRQEQRVVLLRYFEGHPVRVIATILDRPVGTVTQQLCRARARLRQRLEARIHDE
ncbi:sigma factor-like helix-turn-helix DNA-binding protein [Planctomycetota bacterium]